MEFHISKKIRDALKFDQTLFSLHGTIVFPNLAAAREFTKKLQQKYPEIRYQDIFAMGLIDEVLHYVLRLYSKELKGSFAELAVTNLEKKVGDKRTQACVRKFVQNFPPVAVYQDQVSAEDFLEANYDNVSGWGQEFEEMLMLWIENQNPGYDSAKDLIDDSSLEKSASYSELINHTYVFCKDLPVFGPDHQNIIDMLRAPALAHPHSLDLQLEYIRRHWGHLLGDLLNRLLRGIDYLKEVNAFFMRQGIVGLGRETHVLEFGGPGGNEEYERFSPDRDWMPRVVLLAKTTLVWLHQLSGKYNTEISRLDQVPDEELDLISSRGFNALWLIGLWERSDASRIIKNRCGNPDAAASAYSLDDYDIATEIGGWAALENLRWRAWNRGIRLASDMVPNHTGMESKWVEEHPDWFVQLNYPPFPSYTFNSDNLSKNPNIGLYLEDHYYNQSDAAVVFKRVDFRTGDTRYIYHGNDGTHMPWNDTAQLNFLKQEVREAIIQTIIHVAKNFPIIRFDAAMTLAKRHIQRLWFPEPGHGGDIASRSEHGMIMAEFNAAIPQEFWREVVDRCAVEAPDTLLLAEAFWMMEGYFVRTLGMHRVYNSAFMNMLKNEENEKYRQTVKNTISFDKDILKRFVNFMNNPDEETAVAQFGTGDKYFGVCTLMTTMPGLPMFGHGQVEGFTEKYGMEFRRATMNETPNSQLIERHYQEIFPLMKKRYLFADVDQFFLFDLFRDNGSVNENVFAYTNATGNEQALVLYNNCYESCWGTIRISAGYVQKSGSADRVLLQKSLGDALSLHDDDNCYCLMREQRSGLWYLRRSSDIFRSGMTVVLNGYQSQVYLDIHETTDNGYQHYRQLHDHLKGSGVPDISEAIKNIVLGPIYDAFNSSFEADFWKNPYQLNLFVSSDLVGTNYLLGAYKKFIERTVAFSPDPEAYKKSIHIFETLLADLVLLVEFTEDKANLKSGKIKAAAEYFTNGLKSLEQKRSLITVMILYCISVENEEWALQHKVPGVGDFRYQAASLIEVLKTMTSWQTTFRHTSELSEALGYIELQEYLLVNYYDGVRWFNQERFDSLVWWLFVWNALRPQKESNLRVDLVNLHERSLKWQEEQQKSEFKLDVLKRLIQKPIKKSKGKLG